MHTRRGHNHFATGRGYDVFAPVVLAQLIPDDVILDGELVLWSRKRWVF